MEQFIQKFSDKPVRQQINAMVDFHLQAEARARATHAAQNQQRQTKFDARTVFGMGEVFSNLLRGVVQCVVLAADIADELDQPYAIADDEAIMSVKQFKQIPLIAQAAWLRKLCAQKGVPCVAALNAEDMGKRVTQVKQNERTGSAARVVVLALLHIDSIHRSMKVLKQYLQSGFTDEAIDATLPKPGKGKSQKQRQALNPFNPRHFKTITKVEWHLDDLVELYTNMIPQGVQKVGDVTVIGQDAEESRVMVNKAEVCRFRVQTDEGVCTVSLTGSIKANAVGALLRTLQESVQQLQEVRIACGDDAASQKALVESGFVQEDTYFVTRLFRDEEMAWE